ncbi:FmdE family protein [Desulfonatronovibrio hydrogenovorans]|uniref:FmdE family protein n=1 Tax=Desulfonatronovibrio hydrogenovorans TaxID=53245 RepID=UPI0004919252|nr:FmdE family protein [Desulfonatronovibrio hydrogenovorans]
MSCSIDPHVIEDTILFHGHNCPGLSIGIRASEMALQSLGRQKGDQLTVVAETDMCAVDAIQFLTGCTLGKGNLIHRDYGKVAFSFFDPLGQRAVRLTLKAGCFGPGREEMRSLMKKSQAAMFSAQEKERLVTLRQDQIREIMTKELTDLFELTELDQSPPKGAKILDSHECSSCKESTMESRVRLYDGQTYCIPCFELIDQKK